MLGAELFIIFLVFSVALISTFIATPPFIKFAVTHGFTDKPGPRRVNVRAVSRLGGPAMFFGFFLALCLAWDRIPKPAPLFVAATLVTITGAVDDIKSLKPLVKLLGHTVAAAVMYSAGFRIEFISNPFGDYFYLPGWLSVILTIFWIVGITNTLNLIDGLDGLAAGITCIASTTFFLVAMQKGLVESAILAAALVGVTGGFLRWNFYPAKTFMGDSGAYFLGFMVSIIALKGAFKSTTALSFILPVFVLGVPIFDTSFAIVRRVFSRQSVMSTPDKGHVHHRLLAAGWHHRDAVILMYIVTLALSTLALLLSRAYWLTLYLASCIIALAVVLMILGKLKKGKPRAQA